MNDTHKTTEYTASVREYINSLSENELIEYGHNEFYGKDQMFAALENILKDNNKVPKHGSGVGVINVHSRIQLMFGEQYGLEIYSEPDEGTRVVIHIPAIPYTKENAEQLEMQKYIQGRDVDEKE